MVVPGSRNSLDNEPARIAAFDSIESVKIAHLAARRQRNIPTCLKESRRVCTLHLANCAASWRCRIADLQGGSVTSALLAAEPSGLPWASIFFACSLELLSMPRDCRMQPQLPLRNSNVRTFGYARSARKSVTKTVPSQVDLGHDCTHHRSHISGAGGHAPQQSGCNDHIHQVFTSEIGGRSSSRSRD